MPPRQIFLFTTVSDFTAEAMIKQLLDYDRESNEEITIFINSPGGSVLSLFSIIDTMDMIKSPIRTVVIGMAASAAAVIAAFGDNRLITSNSEFMIHEVFSFSFGKTSEMEDQQKRVSKMESRLLNILAKSTGKDIDKLKNAIRRKDKFFSAPEAVRFGLADRIIKSEEAQALKLSEPINVEGYEIDFNNDGLSDVPLLKEGRYEHPVYGVLNLTSEIFDKFVDNFNTNVRGIDISLDYTHENDDGERPAASWIKSLEKRQTDEGLILVGKSEFTPKGKKLVQEKEYKYASADFRIDYLTEQGKHIPYVLCGGTLTNRPFIKGMNPIKLSEYTKNQKEIKQMDKEALIAELKARGVDVVNIQNRLESLESEKKDLENKIKELNALPAEKETEIKALKDSLSEVNKKLTDQEKEAVFNSLLEQGKVIPAQKDSVLGKFENAEEIAAFYKDAPVVIKTKPKGGDGDGENLDEEFTEAELAVINSGEMTADDIRASKQDPTKPKPKSKE